MSLKLPLSKWFATIISLRQGSQTWIYSGGTRLKERSYGLHWKINGKCLCLQKLNKNEVGKMYSFTLTFINLNFYKCFWPGLNSHRAPCVWDPCTIWRWKFSLNLSKIFRKKWLWMKEKTKYYYFGITFLFKGLFSWK